MSLSAPAAYIVRLIIATMLINRLTWAQEWGTLSGRVAYPGTAPANEALQITRDAEVCGQHQLVDESLLVSSKNGGLKNLVVWLSSKADVPVHPSYSHAPKPAEFDNQNCRFVPRIVGLRTKQVLRATNSDPVAHNVAVYGRRNTPFSIGIPENKPLERSFSREELKPIRVDCSIHAWMRAYLIITEHPYSAVTNENGEFKIANLPYGKWQFRFWHERSDYLARLKTTDAELELKRGTYEVEINSSERDLGLLTVEPSEFASED